MVRDIVLAVVVGIVVVVLWVANCSGPQPEVVGVEVSPPSQPGQPYAVIATIRNRRFGEGQANVSFRLHDQQTGQVYEDQATVELRPNEIARVVAEIAAPEGQYTAEADVKYPPG